MYLFCEICPAQWTLSLNGKPLLGTILMEIVLGVAIESNQLIVIVERNQTNHAIRHICVFRLVLGVRLLLERAYVLL